MLIVLMTVSIHSPFLERTALCTVRLAGFVMVRSSPR